MNRLPSIGRAHFAAFFGKKQVGIIRILAILLLLSGLSACSQHEPEHQRRFLGFGTIIEVTIYGTDQTTAHQAMDAIENDFEVMHKAWHPKGENALRRMNLLFSTTEWFSVSPSVQPLIVKSIALSNKSERMFNPAIGKLIDLWGFNQDERPNSAPPTEQQISALVSKHPRMSDIEFEGITTRSRNPDVMLNFGAIAKGYAIDISIEHLKELNIHNAIINAGGDLRAIGKHGDRPWSIGIRNPRKEGVIASLTIENDESIFTSGDYERYFEYNGKRYHHIIDPRTGYPATGTTSVTIVHSDSSIADAASTALFVAGKDHWYTIAKEMGIKYVMLIDSDGNAHMNPAMNARIQFESDNPPKIILSKPL